MALSPVKHSPFGFGETYKKGILDWCVGLKTGETVTFFVETSKAGPDLYLGNGLGPCSSGTATSTGSFTLNDSGANFVTDDIQTDWILVNTTDSVEATINSVAATALGFTNSPPNDMFGALPLDDYEIIPITKTLNVSYDHTNDQLDVSSSLTATTITFEWAIIGVTLNEFFAFEVDVENFDGDGAVYGSIGSTTSTFTQSLSPPITGNGTWTFYGTGDSPGHLRLSESTGNSTFSITGVRAYFCSRPRVQVLDESRSVVETLSTVPSFDGAEGYMYHNQIRMNWTPATAGCYTLCLQETVPDSGAVGEHDAYLVNGEFTAYNSVTALYDGENFWTFTNVGNGWSIQSEKLQHAIAGSPGTNEARGELQTTLDADCTYQIQWKMTNAGAGSQSVDLYLELADGSEVSIGTYTSVFPSDTFTGYDAVAIIFKGTSAATDVIIDNIFVTLQDTPLCCKYESDSICVWDTVPSDALKISTNWNDLPSADFIFGRWLNGDESTETIYVCACVRFARQEDEEFEYYRDSGGTSQTVYSDVVEIEELQIRYAPAWFYRWLAAVGKTDNFTIDGVSYYLKDGSISPNWNKGLSVAPAVIEVVEQSQNVKKIP